MSPRLHRAASSRRTPRSLMAQSRARVTGSAGPASSSATTPNWAAVMSAEEVAMASWRKLHCSGVSLDFRPVEVLILAPPPTRCFHPLSLPVRPVGVLSHRSWQPRLEYHTRERPVRHEPGGCRYRSPQLPHGRRAASRLVSSLVR